MQGWTQPLPARRSACDRGLCLSISSIQRSWTGSSHLCHVLAFLHSRHSVAFYMAAPLAMHTTIVAFGFEQPAVASRVGSHSLLKVALGSTHDAIVRESASHCEQEVLHLRAERPKTTSEALLCHPGLALLEWQMQQAAQGPCRQPPPPHLCNDIALRQKPTCKSLHR